MLLTNLVLLLAVFMRAYLETSVALRLAQSDAYKGVWLRRLFDALSRYLTRTGQG